MSLDFYHLGSFGSKSVFVNFWGSFLISGSDVFLAFRLSWTRCIQLPKQIRAVYQIQVMKSNMSRFMCMIFLSFY